MHEDSTDPEDLGLPHAPWYRFAAYLIRELDRDHTFVVAASLAYFGFLAMFPTLIALVSLFGLIADPHWVQQQVTTLSTLMPAAAASLLHEQLLQIVEQTDATLSLGLLLSILGSLWGASSGTLGLIKTLNMVYDIQEDRSYLRVRAFAVTLALWMMLYSLLIFGVLFGLPQLTWLFPGVSFAGAALAFVRWPIVAALLALGLGLLYRFAPSHDVAHRGWWTWGSTAGTALWLLASLGFSFYVRRLGDFQATYGALASVVVLMLWLYLTGLSVLIGAEVDAAATKLERGEL